MKKEIIEDMVSFNEFIVILSKDVVDPVFTCSCYFEDGKEGDVMVLVDVPNISSPEDCREVVVSVMMSDGFKKKIAEIHQSIFKDKYCPEVEKYLFNRLIKKTIGDKYIN